MVEIVLARRKEFNPTEFVSARLMTATAIPIAVIVFTVLSPDLLRMELKCRSISVRGRSLGARFWLVAHPRWLSVFPYLTLCKNH